MWQGHLHHRTSHTNVAAYDHRLTIKTTTYYTLLETGQLLQLKKRKEKERNLASHSSLKQHYITVAQKLNK